MIDKEPHPWQTTGVLWGKLKERIRNFRNRPTDTEAALWEQLRSGGLHGVRFRRQHAVGPYILDFYCWKANLAIELDGPIHESRRDQDAVRDRYLLSRGIHVLRFSNDEVRHSMVSVLEKISRALNSPSPPGEGDGG